MSMKKDRIEAIIQKRLLHHPDGAEGSQDRFITITDVTVTNDLSIAKI
ncbi:MAG: hypothetical protein ACLVJ6_12515 [Merdibacter sp.]